MSLSCAIILDNGYFTYYAGQTITGRIQVQVNKSEVLRGIIFCMDGRAHVSWDESEGAGQNRRTVTYYAEQHYFNTRHNCLGGGSHDAFTLDAGTYSYPISFPLPHTLPSSFEGKYGYIRYTATALLERPWKQSIENRVVFTIISPYDLRMFPNLLAPGKMCEEKYLCCWCCKKGPITALIRIPKLGYVSGETISVTVEIDNVSDADIHDIELKFQQFTEFHSQWPSRKTKSESKVIEKEKLGTLGPRNSKTLTQPLTIPAVPPTNFHKSNSFIDSRYELLLEVGTGAFHINLRVKLPITIGTVPTFLETPAPSNILPPQSAPPDYETTMRNYPGISQGILSDASDLPALIFRENRMFGRKSTVNGENNAGGFDTLTEYIPRYPMYNFVRPSAPEI